MKLIDFLEAVNFSTVARVLVEREKGGIPLSKGGEGYGTI